MVLWDRVLVTYYRLLIVTMSQSAAIWPQFLRCVWRAPVPKLLVLSKTDGFAMFLMRVTVCPQSVVKVTSSVIVARSGAFD